MNGGSGEVVIAIVSKETAPGVHPANARPPFPAAVDTLNTSHTHSVVRCFLPDGFWEYRPGITSWDSQCVNATSMWLASLYASKERKMHAVKAKSRAG
jgi:hypothetical protein